MTLSVAIVGAGPSGCYLAQALEKAVPDSRIDLIDRLAAPYGLVRYGVAPDHQGTKGVIRQFARLFQRDNVRFFGNVTLGQDIKLEVLRDIYDVVVLATGLSQDKSLGIEGEELSGVMRAGDLTRWWNDHPFSREPEALSGSDLVVLGNGNVAIDIIRLLAKTEDEFESSDLGLHHNDGFVSSDIRTIHIVGRSDAAAAKFDPAMIKELGRLQDVKIIVEVPSEDADTDRSQKCLEALRSIQNVTRDNASKTIHFHFGWTPQRLTGVDGRLHQAHFCRTSGEGELQLTCHHLITAIGFEDDASLPRAQLLDAAQDIDAGHINGNLYACGWFRRGPTGTIPENRADAITVAGRIANDLAAGRLVAGRNGNEQLEKMFPDAVSFEGWQKIDAAEIAGASSGRCRQKIKDHSQMVSISKT